MRKRLCAFSFYNWQSVHAKSLQSCPALCDPTDCSPPYCSVSGILQARIMGWAAMPPFMIFLTQELNSRSMSPALAGGFFTTSATLKPIYMFSSAQFGYSVMSNAF